MPEVEITDLDVLVPPDIGFSYRGEEYRIPGDLDVDSVFGLIKKFKALAEIENRKTQKAQSVERAEKLLNDVRAELLGLFQVCHPDMKTLPFGVQGTQAVLATILRRLGLLVDEEAGDARPPARKPKRKAGAKSRRSSGSRRS